MRSQRLIKEGFSGRYDQITTFNLIVQAKYIFSVLHFHVGITVNLNLVDEHT